DPDRWAHEIDPRAIDGAAWAALVFGASETAVALLTSTPGPADVNVLTNRQIAAARDVVERYAGTGRVLTHTIVHPNLGPGELDARHRCRGRGLPRRDVRRVPLGLRAEPGWAGGSLRPRRRRAGPGCRSPLAKFGGRGDRPGRERVRGARYNVVPDAAPAAGG